MMTAEHKTALVDRITALKGSGFSQAKIAATLNEEQLKTPTGREWTGVLVGSFAHRMNIVAAGSETKETTVASKKVKVTRAPKARRTRPVERVEQSGSEQVVDSIRAVVNSNMTDGEKIRVISRFL